MYQLQEAFLSPSKHGLANAIQQIVIAFAARVKIHLPVFFGNVIELYP
jgi:hypothetical protein